MALSAQADLRETVLRLDTEFFDAYNTCGGKDAAKRLAVMRGLFDDGVEFYHDQTGLTVGADAVMAAVEANICGKVTRKPVAESLEVHELKGFGAIEMGTHWFWQDGRPVGRARFVHVWRKLESGWKLTRVLSYDHQPI
jgi:hypothetical protein